MRNFDEFVKLAADKKGENDSSKRIPDYLRLHVPTEEQRKAWRDRQLKADHDRESAKRDSWIDPYGEDIPHDDED